MPSPFRKSFSAPVPNVAAGSSDASTIGRAPYDGTVSAVSFVADALLTGANTNTRKLSLVNKKQDGGGTVVVATLQFNNGVNATAFAAKTITLTATAADLVVANGDVLVWQSDSVGTGIADPGGLAVVTFTPA